MHIYLTSGGKREESQRRDRGKAASQTSSALRGKTQKASARGFVGCNRRTEGEREGACARKGKAPAYPPPPMCAETVRGWVHDSDDETKEAPLLFVLCFWDHRFLIRSFSFFASSPGLRPSSCVLRSPIPTQGAHTQHAKHTSTHRRTVAVHH